MKEEDILEKMKELTAVVAIAEKVTNYVYKAKGITVSHSRDHIIKTAEIVFGLEIYKSKDIADPLYESEIEIIEKMRASIEEAP